MRKISIIKERILKFLDYVGDTKYECYKKSGITNGILSQSNGISEDSIMKFVTTYSQINPVWLLTGEGDMDRSSCCSREISTSEILAIDGVEKIGLSLPSINNSRDTYRFMRVVSEQMWPTIPENSIVVARGVESSMWDDIRENGVYIIEARGQFQVCRLRNRPFGASKYFIAIKDRDNSSETIDHSELLSLWEVREVISNIESIARKEEIALAYINQ